MISLAAGCVFQQRLNLSYSVDRVPVLCGGFQGPLSLFVGVSRVSHSQWGIGDDDVRSQPELFLLPYSQTTPSPSASRMYW